MSDIKTILAFINILLSIFKIQCNSNAEENSIRITYYNIFIANVRNLNPTFECVKQTKFKDVKMTFLFVCLLAFKNEFIVKGIFERTSKLN